MYIQVYDYFWRCAAHFWWWSWWDDDDDVDDGDDENMIMRFFVHQFDVGLLLHAR